MNQRAVKVIRRRSHPLERLRNLVAYKDLLRNSIAKELKVRYRSSFLGFVWSMLNPILYLAIFSLVFSVFMDAGIPNFPIYLLAGLLPWNLFSMSMSSATVSIVNSGSLVTKVYFPREILPLSSIGGALIHFVLQFGVLLAVLTIFRYPIDWAALPLVPMALFVELMVLVGACLLLSAFNVYLRDIQHLLELLLLAWFWMTPIVYPVALVHDKLSGSGDLGRWALSVYLANPMTAVVLGFQRGLYGKVHASTPDGQLRRILIDAPISWYAWRLGLIAAGAVVLIAVAWMAFSRLEENFAEEI